MFQGGGGKRETKKKAATPPTKMRKNEGATHKRPALTGTSFATKKQQGNNVDMIAVVG